MTDQLFELDNFRGPLDLLLHLVREQEVDIVDVDLSRLCDSYFEALQRIEALDIDVAGEFLVMAATLMLIKSRSVLPREEVDLAEEIDPGDELIGQLLEYRRFKSLSLELGRQALERASRHARGGDDLPPAGERELAEIGLWDLVGTYARLVEELDLERRFDALSTQRPLRAYMRDVLATIADRETATFRDLVAAAGGGGEIYAVFLAVLELARSTQIVVAQRGTGGEISLRLREDRDESLLAGLLADDRGDGSPSDGPAADPAREDGERAADAAPTGSQG